MRNIVVFGANGPTGRLVVEQAGAAGCRVTAVTRRPESFPVRGAHVRVAEADVLDAGAVGHVVAGHDVVISALGVPFGREPVSVYSSGATHMIRAMAAHGVRRLVAVTSTIMFGTPAPDEGFLFRRVLEPAVARFMGRTVYDDMRRMEEIVRRSDLDWTVIRPGGLFDAPDVSDYRIGTSRLPGRYTARADLAHELLRQADERRYVHEFVDVRTTQGTPTFVELIRKEALGR
ncbi:NAD(P)-dependent oxidoreductase [Streptomyces carpinensis]|uniref:NAD(P)H-binding protein n=1 Tax=Streptomyces carpinensis TaxID=66369 RepID=A0ABV1W252_9ACTN|nr:NAD(P)H-binding protein [Streptomyces carpinensis]